MVVDDGSIDDTSSVLAAHGDLTTIRNAEPLGPAAARNRGVAITSAPLISFVDADDLLTEGALEQRLALLRDGAFDLVATRSFSRPMNEPSVPVPARGNGWWAFRFGTALLTRDAWDRVGPIDESLLRAEDVEWWLRARSSGIRIGRSDLVTLVVRTHSDSWAASVDTQISATFDVIRRRLADR